MRNEQAAYKIADTADLQRQENIRTIASSSTAPALRRGVDAQFFALTIILLLVGLLMLFSVSYPKGYSDNGDSFSIIKKQLGWAVLGVLGMYFSSHLAISPLGEFAGNRLNPKNVIARINTRKLMRVVFYVSLAALILLAGISIAAILGNSSTVIAFGNSIGRLTKNGATRWIGWGSISVQPSEFVKIGLIFFLASRLSMKIPMLWRVIIPVTLGVVLIVGIEPHASAAIIIFAIAALMIFVGGINKKLIAAVLVVVALLGFGALKLAQKSHEDALVVYESVLAEPDSTKTDAMEAYRDAIGEFHVGRIVQWLHPDFDTQGSSYQTNQSLLAIGSGGLLGTGIGQSRQKYSYLPFSENDYIFSIICEEVGFIGAMVILLLFTALIMRGFWIAAHARDKFTGYVVIGIMSMIAVQVVFNIGVVTNMLPSTGISLPFFSSGGTALCIQLFEMGLVMAASRDMVRY